MALLIALAPALASAAELDPLWQAADPAQVALRGQAREPWLSPPVARHFTLDRAVMQTVLGRAPAETVAGAEPALLRVPKPDGTWAHFLIVEAPVMAPELAAKFPEIKTYLGQGVEDPLAAGRFGVSPAGFYGQVLTPNGSYYVEPRFKGDDTLHAAYFRRDYQRDVQFTCFTASPADREPVIAPRELLRSGPTLRSYRLAVAANGEYTQFHGGTVAAGLAAIVQAVNRVTGVFEVEVGVRLNLVANNNLLVFTNAATDPYPINSPTNMVNLNTAVLDLIIGRANYDIGHVFGTGGGGVAFLGTVCFNGFKGAGATGLPLPVGDAFFIDFVAHEIGHQFGGNHSFNGIIGNCVERNGPTAYEPGSGSTIMAYAGICGADNLQLNSDPYFHSVSFDEILSFVSGVGGACAVATATGNRAPEVSAGPNFTIPRLTPFMLTASGSDPDGDPLTYCWEQRNLGPAQTLAAADNGSSPLFRSFPPTTNAFRVFPRLANLLAGTPSLGEQLPSLGRTMNFRVTARDNRAGGGGVNTADMQVVVDATSGPFGVVSPRGPANLTGAINVTWDVANTTNAIVRATNVNIRLSVDGGLTFPIVLAADTPNDGAETVVLPPITVANARVKVEPTDNAFFAINTNSFALSGAGAADLALSGSLSGPAAVGTNLTYNLTVTNRGPDTAAPVVVTNRLPATATFIGATASQGTFTSGGGNVVFQLGQITNGGVATLTVTVFPTTFATLTNRVTVSALTTDPVPANNLLTFINTPLSPLPTLTAAGATLTAESFRPPNGAIQRGETVTVDLALRNAGLGVTANLVATLESSGGVTPLSGPQSYGAVSSLSGVVSRPFTFTAATNTSTLTATLRLQDGATAFGFLNFTFNLDAVTAVTNPAAITIHDAGPATPYPSTIHVAGVPGVISKVTVTLDQFSHTFPDDVDVLLVSPTGQSVVLMSDAGGSHAVSGLTFTFDDAAAWLLPNNTPLGSGAFRLSNYSSPEGDPFTAPAPAGPYDASLAAFNGVSPNGAWSLFVVDDTAGDQGVIAGGWSLRIESLTPVNPPGDLGVTIADAPDPATVGFPLIYTVTVTNRGGTTAHGVLATNPLPAGVNFVSATATQGVVGHTNGVVTFAPGALAAGAQAGATIVVTPTAAGSLSSTVAVAGSLVDTNTANNTATALTTVGNPAPAIVTAGTTLVTESFLPPNGAIDPGETVTLNFALRNTGTAPTGNLVARLLAGGGVAAPSGAQNYGVLAAGGAAVERPFTFTADGTNGALITATLQLQDGAANLGAVAFTFTLGTTRTFASIAGISIPHVGNASPYPSTILVSGVDAPVGRLTVTLEGLSHGFPPDLDILLVGPSGRGVVLMSDAGSGPAVSGLTLTFDDAAPGGLPAIGPITSGAYQPTDFEPGESFFTITPVTVTSTQLAVFNGTDPNGVWALYVVDDFAGDSGSIAGWRLDIEILAPSGPDTVPPSLSALLTPERHALITLTGQPGRTYIVDAATNLVPPVTWLPIATNPLMLSSNATFLDTNAPAIPLRFYRARESQ